MKSSTEVVPTAVAAVTAGSAFRRGGLIAGLILLLRLAAVEAWRDGAHFLLYCFRKGYGLLKLTTTATILV